ncbi:SGNH/GDSL hydrolase family protein [Cerasicoccus arenae]|uniref:SGNH hydrolase-type esterase domain-containing protein n=1 Tax=Cerasicoccus arenae TaxID=424488 RepID=A0A8J3GC07_9BACT|nr:SGNH/GDSL hydrolase family protein [Cerasicoccus arenae]MBK1859487.1 SGNH/GDSL hydrolase family protein [Cerasicoccus arenae]GHB94921.1 hypothetical protein GCM10007047_08090 [Cerasicoccus arenae]
MHPHIEWLTKRFARNKLTRLLAFGSSNTERRLPGMHWFDCLDLAIQQGYGRPHRFINTGIGGETTRELLARFEQDAAFYQPHAVFITIGGNDSNPAKEMDASEFEGNLKELHRRFTAMDTRVIFQTYYAVNSDGSEHYVKFEAFMDIVRRVAADTDSALIDHFARWTPLRLKHPEIYLPLMIDAFHVNYHGNQVMGVDLARSFGQPLNHDSGHWDEALRIQQLMDQLSVQ